VAGFPNTPHGNQISPSKGILWVKIAVNPIFGPAAATYFFSVQTCEIGS